MKIQLDNPVYLSKPVSEVEVTALGVNLAEDKISVVVGVPPSARSFLLPLPARVKADLLKAVSAAIQADADENLDKAAKK